VTGQRHDSTTHSSRESRPGVRWTRLIIVAPLAAALGAAGAVIAKRSSGSTASSVANSRSLHAGFQSDSMTIIDQPGTVNVNVWVTNVGRATTSATCAVIVTSGSGSNVYQGSAAFQLPSIAPHASRHIVRVVSGVYLPGDATAPVGSRSLPLPQDARLGKGSSVECCEHVGARRRRPGTRD